MIETRNADALGGNAQIQNFSIEMNATMFEMLSSKVYTDTIMAPIREWSTNAVDACIAGNLPVKFDVHLPTILEPFFSVRDYGTGLSNEDVMGLYSTLGASTKRESNAFNGVFGVGRNSGLAYTDSFQVDSFFNGTKISYLVSTSNGIPAMIPMGQTKTNESNGLRLELTVKHKDIDTFTKRSERVFRYFDVRPSTNIKLDYQEPKKIVEGSDWYLEESSYSYRSNNQPLAIMGNVAYNIERNGFEDRNIYNLLNSPIRFEVPLGEVSITPGRESLSMDERSIAYLTKRFKKAQEESVKAVIRTVELLPNKWDRIIAFNKAVSEMPSGLCTDVKWTSGLKYITSTGSNNRIKFGDGEDLPYGISMHVYNNYQVTGRNLVKEAEGHHSHFINDEIKFMLADQRMFLKEAVHAFRDKYYELHKKRIKVVVIKSSELKKGTEAGTLAKLKAIIKELGEPAHVLASTYAPGSTTVSTKGQTVITAKDFTPLKFTRGGVSDVTAFRGGLLSSYKDIKKFFYVEMSSYEIQNIDKAKLNMYMRFKDVYVDQNHSLSNYEQIMIVGVPKGGMKNIEKDPRFVPLEGNLEAYAKYVSFVDKSESANFAELVRYTSSSVLDSVIELTKGTELSRTMGGLLKFGKEHPKRYSDTPTDGIAEVFKCNTKKPNVPMTLAQMEKEYPLLNVLFNSGRTKVAEFVRYIKLEDKCKGTENE